MKEKLVLFFKPRAWTFILMVALLAWQYTYAYRGVDIESLSILQSYFNFGLSTVNWNNFLIRTFSLGLIWLIVACLIFMMLWLAESLSIDSHNRRIAKKYVNQPKEDYAHLLRVRNIGLKSHFISTLWLSAGLVALFFGIFMMPQIVESTRNSFVFAYLDTMVQSGEFVDYNNATLTITSFLLCLPVWYLYATAETFAFVMSKIKDEEAHLEEDHFAIPIKETATTTDDDEDDSEEEGNNSHFSPGHVI